MATFLKSLLNKQKAKPARIIEHDGVKFSVRAVDVFTQQNCEMEAEALTEKWMEKHVPKEWKNMPGAEQGKSRWDEKRNSVKNVEFTILILMLRLAQEDGSPIYTNEQEREEFKKYLTLESTLWTKVTDSLNEEKKTEAPSVKKGPRKK